MSQAAMRYDAMDLRAIDSTGRLDANESVFFARQLEYVKSKTFDVKRAPLNAMRLMPVSYEIPAGATTHTYTQYDGVSMAKIIANYANDLPRVEVKGRQFTSPIHTIGNSYGYNIQEIKSALFAGTNLSSKKATLVVRSQEEKINQLAFAGDTEFGLPGLLTNANVPEVTLLADSTSSSKTFATKLADQIIRDVNSVIQKVTTQSKGVHRANQVWMPLEQLGLLATTPRSTTSDTTILEFLQKTNPGVTFEAVIELDGAGASGADRMYALENSSENWQLEIPELADMLPPQPQGLEFVVPTTSRFAGVIIEYPLAFAFADGI